MALQHKTTSGLYLGWNGHGNLGDDAVYQCAQQRFPEIRWASLDTSAVGPLCIDPILFQRSRSLIALLGGGTLINTPSNDVIQKYKELSRIIGGPIYTFGTGVEDPEVFKSVVGWTDQRAQWAELFAELPIVGVRGPRSKALLNDVGLTNVVVVGDPAVCCHTPLVEQEDENYNHSCLRIGINYGHPYGVPMWGNQKELHEEVSKYVRLLSEMGHRIEVFSVHPPDLAWCNLLLRDSSAERAAESFLITSPSEYLEYVRRFDFVVSLKLHAGILAMASNVPTLILEYSPKCLDFAESANWKDFVLSTGRLTVQDLLEMTFKMCDDLRPLRRQLSTNMANLAHIFQSYCSSVLSLK